MRINSVSVFLLNFSADMHEATPRSIFERYGLANVTRSEIDLHTMELLGIQYGSENISRAAKACAGNERLKKH